jgi:WD40 repeat protein
MSFLNEGRTIGGFDKEEPVAPAAWDAATGQRVVRLEPVVDAYLTVAANPGGKRFAWAEVASGGVDVHWRDEGGTAIGSAHLNVPRVRALAVDPTGARLAALTTAPRVGGDQSVWIVDAAGQEAPKEVIHDVFMYGGLAFSPDGRLLAISGRDVVHVIRTADGAHQHDMTCSEATTCLAFSPDGRRLAAVGYDGIATLFDPVAGKRIFQLRGLVAGRPDDMAADARVAFSADGQWLVSTNWDGSLNVWDGTSMDAPTSRPNASGE